MSAIWGEMAPTVGVVATGLVYFTIGLRQYSKFTKPQRVVFQVGLGCFLLALCLFIASTLLRLVACNKDIRTYI